MSFHIGKNPCPRCRANGNDAIGDNFMFYGEGRGGHCFACGFSILSDDEKEKRGIGAWAWDEEQEEIMSKETLTREEIEQIKGYTGERGCGLRGITDETYKAYLVRHKYDEESGEPVEQYYPVTESGKASGYKIRTLPKDFHSVGRTGKDCDLFGMWKWKNSSGRTAVITAGEIDCLSAFQMLEDYRKSRNSDFEPTPVVSSTIGESGSDKQIAKFYDWFDGFDKIVVCYDQDSAGQEAVEKLASVLPKGKMFVMHLPMKDTNLMLTEGKSKVWLDCFYRASPYTPTGVVGSSQLYEEILKEAHTTKLEFPPFMKKLNDMMAGGPSLGTIGTISASTGLGKCHGKGTPVLMADMTIKLVEDIVQGDKVMGADGSPRVVLGTTKGIGELFRVDQGKGDSYVVNSEHMLSVKANTTFAKRGFFKNAVSNIKVTDFIKLPTNYREHILCGYRADLTHLGQDNAWDVDDAYFLGLWLAEGTASKPQVTLCKTDMELHQFIYQYAEKKGYRINISKSNDRKGSTAYDYANGCLVWLRELGVLNNKHIPSSVFNADYKTRLTVLAGLVDGDGFLASKCIEFCMKDDNLSPDIVKLARSVGICVRCTDKFSKCQNFDGATYKRMLLSGNTNKIPNRLPRKHAGPRLQIKDALRSCISVEAIGVGEYFGFQVDGDSLYCLGDFTVTHNSSVVNECVYHWIFNTPHKIGVVSMEQNKGQYGELMLSRHIKIKLGKLTQEAKLEILESEPVKEAQHSLFYNEDGTDRWMVVDDRDGDVDSLKAAIEKLIISCDCKVIVIDTISDMFDGLTTDEQAVLMKWQKSIVNRYNVAIINISHQRKAASGEKDGSQGAMGNESSLHGTSTLIKSSAWILMMSRNKTSEDILERNTVHLMLPKNRGAGETGPAGSLYYDNNTHTLHDLDGWLAAQDVSF